MTLVFFELLACNGIQIDNEEEVDCPSPSLYFPNHLESVIEKFFMVLDLTFL